MSLIVGPYYQGNPKVKPKQWGNFSAVQSSLFKNAERMGIDPASIDVAIPLWNPGDQTDYARGVQGVNSGAVFTENSLTFSTNDFISLPPLDNSLDFTIFSEASFTSTLSTIIDIATRSDDIATNWALKADSSGNISTYFRGHTGGPTMAISEDLRNTGLRKCALTHESGVSAYLYLDSLQKSDFTNFTTTAFSGSTDRAALGVMYDSTPSSYHNGQINNILKVNAILDSSILSLLFDNPYALWQPVPQITYFLPQAAGASAALTGTATDGVTESQIVTGGETIIITLTGDTFLAAGTGPIGSTANTQALIDGIDGDVAGGTGWDAQVKANLVPADDVARDSDTQCTVTTNAAASYAISTDETVTVTLPAEVLTGGVEISGITPFDITNESAFNPAWAISSNVLLQPGVTYD